ncbi:hypothetical protein V6N12_055613 [Hibiscus sabdariffa]|uniref:RNase H type-1 domain-containing protein n=1 Tax=Hibiscus sabdariffa TaxID=183260 RepID=A0ABR2BUC0_9ROSI
MASPTGQWDFSRMSVLLPESILNWISAIRPPHPLLGNDAPSWRWTDNQSFSSKVALVRPCKLVEFMALPFDEWLMRNLRGGGGFAIDVARWGVLFPTICWILWKRRCKQVMDPDSGVVSEPFLVGHQLAAAYAAFAIAGAKVGGAQVPVRRWFKPRVGEQNKVADALAALGRNGPIGVALYEHPPASINRILVDDSCDMTTTCAGG